MGWGGSILQWNPGHKIGFGYHSLYHHQIDPANFRSSKLQEIVRQIVDGTYKPETKKSGMLRYVILGMVVLLVVGFALFMILKQ